MKSENTVFPLNKLVVWIVRLAFTLIRRVRLTKFLVNLELINLPLALHFVLIVLLALINPAFKVNYVIFVRLVDLRIRIDPLSARLVHSGNFSRALEILIVQIAALELSLFQAALSPVIPAELENSLHSSV